MIFYKWGTDYDDDTSKAPSILTIMINMAVKIGSVEGKPLFDSLFGLSQEVINISIIVICLLLIPIMLLIKPIYYYKKKKSTQGISFRNDNLSLIENENKKNDYILGENNNNIINDVNDNINNNLIIDDIDNEMDNNKDEIKHYCWSDTYAIRYRDKRSK